jgi:tetratricopeptide (TPR) repeat protein
MPETSSFCRGPFANKLKQPFLARRIKSEFEKAVELDPTSIDGRHGLIQFYSQAPGVMGGSMDKAREQAREIGKLNAMRGHVELGTLLETKDKDLAGAEYEFAAAITAAPDSSYGFSSLATFYRRQKRFDEAVATWDRLLKARPDALKAHLNIAFNLVLSVTTEPRNHGTTEPRNYGTTELRNHGTTEPRNYGTTEPRNSTSTQMRADTPADAGDADGCRLAFTRALTRLFENERPREGNCFPRSFTCSQFRLVVGQTFKVICAHLRQARAQRATHLRASASKCFPLLLFGPPTKTTATSRFTAGNQ